MNEKELIKNLKTELNKFENKIYFTGETRIDLMIKDVLSVLEKQQAEIEKYKMLLAETNVQFLNSDLKTKRKNEEDLEMLYAGCQAEIEKKDKIINLMATDIYGMQMECNRYFKDTEEVKQYFERKIK